MGQTSNLTRAQSALTSETDFALLYRKRVVFSFSCRFADHGPCYNAKGCPDGPTLTLFRYSAYTSFHYVGVNLFMKRSNAAQMAYLIS